MVYPLMLPVDPEEPRIVEICGNINSLIFPVDAPLIVVSVISSPKGDFGPLVAPGNEHGKKPIESFRRDTLLHSLRSSWHSWAFFLIQRFSKIPRVQLFDALRIHFPISPISPAPPFSSTLGTRCSALLCKLRQQPPPSETPLVPRPQVHMSTYRTSAAKTGSPNLEESSGPCTLKVLKEVLKKKLNVNNFSLSSE